jgi:hypothetical protein
MSHERIADFICGRLDAKFRRSAITKSTGGPIRVIAIT